MALAEAQYTIDEIERASSIIPANPKIDVLNISKGLKMHIQPLDLVLKEDTYKTNQALSYAKRIVIKYLPVDFTITYQIDIEDNNVVFDNCEPKDPELVGPDDGITLDDHIIETFYQDAKNGETLTYNTLKAYDLEVLGQELVKNTQNYPIEPVFDFYVWTYGSEGLLNDAPVYFRRTIYADLIYGFIEHFDDLNPETRIEYIEQNKDFKPMHTNIDTGEATYGDWNKWDWLTDVKPYLIPKSDDENMPIIPLDLYDISKDINGNLIIPKNYPVYKHFSWIPKL